MAGECTPDLSLSILQGTLLVIEKPMLEPVATYQHQILNVNRSQNPSTQQILHLPSMQ